MERLGHDGLDRARALAAGRRRATSIDDEIELVVQVLGKVRGRVQAPRATPTSDALKRLAREAVASHLAGKTVMKDVVVPGRLVNFVVNKKRSGTALCTLAAAKVQSASA